MKVLAGGHLWSHRLPVAQCDQRHKLVTVLGDGDSVLGRELRARRDQQDAGGCEVDGELALLEIPEDAAQRPALYRVGCRPGPVRQRDRFLPASRRLLDERADNGVDRLGQRQLRAGSLVIDDL